MVTIVLEVVVVVIFDLTVLSVVGGGWQGGRQGQSQGALPVIFPRGLRQIEAWKVPLRDLGGAPKNLQNVKTEEQRKKKKEE